MHSPYQVLVWSAVNTVIDQFHSLLLGLVLLIMINVVVVVASDFRMLDFLFLFLFILLGDHLLVRAYGFLDIQ